MNRQLKFRAWSGEKMFYDHDSNGRQLGYILSRYESNIMQFTGIKDNDDKEIYEGDVVNWTEEDEALFVVEFGKYCTDETKQDESDYWHCGFYLKPIQDESDEYKQENWGLTEGFEEYKFTILGNIYQNPELLKK